MPKYCKHTSCSNRASFGIDVREYCSFHKLSNMINLNKNKICESCNEVRATFGKDLRTHCGKCKKKDMRDFNHRKCKCGVSPSFNYPEELTPLYCGNCKKEGMVNKKGLMCNDCPIGQRGNPKYRNYCTFCFTNRFPYDPLTSLIRKKSKENQVKEFINKEFKGFTHDKSIYTGQCDCSSRRRLDHFKLIDNTLLVVETDEQQHKRYDSVDEEIRYDDLFMIHSGKWIYIRFNPDSYKIKGKTRNTKMSIRLQQLKKEIQKQIQRIKMEENGYLVEIVYLYYDIK